MLRRLTRGVDASKRLRPNSAGEEPCWSLSPTESVLAARARARRTRAQPKLPHEYPG